MMFLWCHEKPIPLAYCRAKCLQRGECWKLRMILEDEQHEVDKELRKLCEEKA